MGWRLLKLPATTWRQQPRRRLYNDCPKHCPNPQRKKKTVRCLYPDAWPARTIACYIVSYHVCYKSYGFQILYIYIYIYIHTYIHYVSMLLSCTWSIYSSLGQTRSGIVFASGVPHAQVPGCMSPFDHAAGTFCKTWSAPPVRARCHSFPGTYGCMEGSCLADAILLCPTTSYCSTARQLASYRIKSCHIVSCHAVVCCVALTCTLCCLKRVADAVLQISHRISHDTALRYTALHCTALRYPTLHYTTLHCIELQRVIVPRTTLRWIAYPCHGARFLAHALLQGAYKYIHVCVYIYIYIYIYIYTYALYVYYYCYQY